MTVLATPTPIEAPAATPAPGSRPFLRHFHYFRAFAIVNVVLAHLWYIPEELAATTGAKIVRVTREVFFHNATLYFVFVSGFLFFYLAPRLRLRRYYRSKLIRVVIPYCFITTVVLLWTHRLRIGEGMVPPTFFATLGEALLHGKAQIHLWYIPFIVPIFVVSPLLLRLPAPVFRWIVLVAALLPLAGTRSGVKVTWGQYLYFFPVYLLGGLAAVEHLRFAALLRQRWRLLLIVASLTTVLLGVLLTVDRSVDDHPIEALHYLQKLMLGGLVLTLLERWRHKRLALLDHLADLSFPIYFLHLSVGGALLRGTWLAEVAAVSPLLVAPVSLVSVSAALLATVAICALLRRWLGPAAPYLIGA